MPRVVRNFWIEGNIDGYKSQIKGGPRSKDGGFDLRIYMRQKGEIFNPVKIFGKAKDEKTLVLYINVNSVNYIIETIR